jgi:uncharacterized SAM-binding protein YcdF (DUF218 family)
MKQTDNDLLKLIWEYMAIETPLRQADAIVVGGCTDPGVAAYAAELFGMNFAPIIVFSGYQQPGMNQTEADFMSKIARDRGVPESAILREQVARNTGENIRLSQAMLADNGITPTAVILVHKPYMARRFLATAEAQWIDPQPDFIIRHEAISLTEYTLKRGTSETVRKVMGDFQRMRPYAKKGYQSAQVIPDEVQAAYDTLLYRGHHSG